MIQREVIFENHGSFCYCVTPKSMQALALNGVEIIERCLHINAQ